MHTTTTTTKLLRDLRPISHFMCINAPTTTPACSSSSVCVCVCVFDRVCKCFACAVCVDPETTTMRRDTATSSASFLRRFTQLSTRPIRIRKHNVHESCSMCVCLCVTIRERRLLRTTTRALFVKLRETLISFARLRPIVTEMCSTRVSERTSVAPLVRDQFMVRRTVWCV